ncbi:MAG: YebC/PmpR family DNA-binding transcriptional regulator [Clostridia bacterium]|jgi:YebC/PmpR family DNA-binding regulatory protein|nr:YebC/PmpR family DNA-binding transcriptional regulator [Clostridia bacterium]MDD4276061.1 YebC/PmpR family DNA-binding transcriptional regulator [Clostridia bacterium]
MSGHSKWANIKRTKGKNDAAKGKIFTKLVKDIAIAVKIGGADPDLNSKLRDAIFTAKVNNLPNDNINRTIKKAMGESDSSNYEEVVYEGYGPGGSAVIIYTLTDNKNRTAGEIRHTFDKYGGALGMANCVSYLFKRKGIIVIEDIPSVKEDDLMMDALEAGAEDVENDEGVYEIITDPADISTVKQYLENKNYILVSSEIEMVPAVYMPLDEAKMESFKKLLNTFEESDDVQEVYHNVELTEEEDYE